MTAIERMRYRIGETGIAGESALLEAALAEAVRSGYRQRKDFYPEAEAGEGLREALLRMTVAGEEVYGAENLQGEVYHDLLEPEVADQLRDAIEYARARLAASAPAEGEGK